MKKITAEIEKYLIDNYEMSSHELSKSTGIPASTIRAIWNRNNIKKIKYFHPPIEEFIDLYEKYRSSRKMAKHYGTQKTTILNYAKSIGYNTSLKLLLNKDSEKDIINGYNTYSSSYFANKYKVSPSKISQVWRQNGLRGKEKRMYSFINQDYFECIDCQSKAYFLGFICADGCLHKPIQNKTNKQDVIRITIQKSDVKILELFKQELQTDKPINIFRNKYVTLEVSSQKMSNDLQNLGISYNKTYGNTIPHIDSKFMLPFIRGYFDGDGNIGLKKNTKDCSIAIAGYQSNMLKIADYLETLNIFSSFIIDKRKYTNDENNKFGSLTITNNLQKYAFAQVLYDNTENFHMDRKYDLAKNYISIIENSKEIRDKQAVIYYNHAVHPLC